MKTGIYLSVIFFIFISLAKAQKPITITDDTIKFGNTLCPGIWVDIPEVNVEAARANWKKTIEKGSKSKAIINGSEITIFGALLKDISETPINIFSALKNNDSVVKLFVAVELQRDVFTSINSKEHEQMKSMAKQFSKDQYIEVAEEQLSAQESKLKDLEKELASLRKDKKKLDEMIQSSNASIAQENYQIASVKKSIEVTDNALDAKSTELSTMANDDSKKAVQSEVKNLQKEKKSNLKKISASENRISKANDAIKDSNNAISLNLKHQEDVSFKINTQKLEVKKYSEKLKTIESY